MTSPEHLARRILNFIDRVNEQGCWLWGGAVNRGGYGTMTVAGRTTTVPRVAFAIAVGKPMCELDHVCHDCPGGDNPLCCNPAHLFEGTRSDNVRDAMEKGLWAPPKTSLLGESNPACKLALRDVIAIRDGLSQGTLQKALAERFGVTPSTVSAIARRRIWRHA